MQTSAAPESTAPAPARWVTFRVGARRYGLPVASVRDVVEVPRLTARPGAPRGVLGMLETAGEAVTVIDARQLFDAGRRLPGPAARVIVVEGDAGSVGLLVDSIADIRRIAPEQIERRPAANDPGCVCGVCRAAGEETVCLDGDRLAPAAAGRKAVAC